MKTGKEKKKREIVSGPSKLEYIKGYIRRKYNKETGSANDKRECYIYTENKSITISNKPTF